MNKGISLAKIIRLQQILTIFVFVVIGLFAGVQSLSNQWKYDYSSGLARVNDLFEKHKNKLMGGDASHFMSEVQTILPFLDVNHIFIQNNVSQTFLSVTTPFTSLDRGREYVEKCNLYPNADFLKLFSGALFGKCSYSTVTYYYDEKSLEKLLTVYWPSKKLIAGPGFSFLVTILAISLFLGVLMSLFLNLAIKKYFYQPLKLINERIQELMVNPSFTSGRDLEIPNKTLREVSQLTQKFQQLFSEKMQLELEVNRAQFSSRLEKTFSRLSHDIRDPVGAMKMDLHLVKNIIPDQTYQTIKQSLDRITDITEQSLMDYKKTKSIRSEILNPIIQSVILEKEHRIKKETKKIQIKFLDLRHSQNLFARVNSVLFYRLVSNLLNNAIHAVVLTDSEQKLIEVAIESLNDQIQIRIKDNGCGMSQGLINRIIREPQAFISEAGTGIGLSSALEYIRMWDGEFEIDSEPNVGTKITIKLPKSDPPTWFIDQISISKGMKVVVVDDTEQYHQQLRDKLNSVSVVSFYSLQEFLKWFYTLEDKDNYTYFVDYEFRNESDPLQHNGLRTIVDLGIQSQAVLITNNYDSAVVKDLSEENEVKMIPKPILMNFPVIVT